MTDLRRALLEDAIGTWGVEAQLNVAIEEMAELIHALCRWTRDSWDANKDEVEMLRAQILEEVADAKIMIEQLQIIFGNTEVFEQTKLNRLKSRIAEAKERRAVFERNPTGITADFGGVSHNKSMVIRTDDGWTTSICRRDCMESNELGGGLVGANEEGMGTEFKID